MSETVVVTGVPGVGASRVCEEARRELGDAYTLVNVGDVMLEEALERGLATDRNELAQLPIQDQRVLQRRAGEYIERKAREGPLLVSTHLVVHTVYGFVPGLPDAMRRDMNPSTLVVIDASTAVIQQRRDRSEHTYPSEGEATVSFHRQLQNVAALTYATEMDIPIRHVSNESDLTGAAERLATVVRAAIGE